MSIHISNNKMNRNYMSSSHQFAVEFMVLIICTILSMSTIASESVESDNYSGCVISFADRVIRYDPLYSGGPAPTCSVCIDPCDALGAPDRQIADANHPNAVTLGKGGLLELMFIDNLITNSGDAFPDVFVFEVGDDIEMTFVAIRPTKDTSILLGLDHEVDHFLDIGNIGGGSSAIDIDRIFPGFEAGTLIFNAVQLIDDSTQGGNTGLYAGADIDAVGTLSISNDISVGDINRDGVVDFRDLALLSENWLKHCSSISD